MKKYLLGIFFMIIILVFASCNISDIRENPSEVSSEPISEESSLEISSEIESEISTEVVSKEPYSFVPEVLFVVWWDKTDLTDEL